MILLRLFGLEELFNGSLNLKLDIVQNILYDEMNSHSFCERLVSQ
jgi:hypothetical protein